MLTRSLGLLDPAYPDLGPALDAFVFRVMEVDAEKARDYIAAERPDYVTFEKWIVLQLGGRPNPNRVARWNEANEHRTHLDPRKIDETYPDIGFDPEKVTISSAVLLNCLQDWALFHRRDLTDGQRDLPDHSVPLISSIDFGPLRVMQLPRTWQKVLLEAEGILHPEYPGCGGGLDQRVLEALALDREKTVAYLQEERPQYTDFEAWILEQSGGAIDRASVDAFQRAMLARCHPEPKRSGILRKVGLSPDSPIERGVDLNHLDDWHSAWQSIT